MSFWSSFHFYRRERRHHLPPARSRLSRVGNRRAPRRALILVFYLSQSVSLLAGSLAASRRRRDNDNELGFALQDFGKLFDRQVRCLYHIYEVNPHFCPIIWLTFHLLDQCFVLRRTCLQIGNIELKQRSTGASLGNHGPRMRCPF